jgi:hypothetical protein
MTGTALTDLISRGLGSTSFAAATAGGDRLSGDLAPLLPCWRSAT